MSSQQGDEMPTPTGTQGTNRAAGGASQPPMMSSQATRDRLQALFPEGTSVPTQSISNVWRSYDDMDEEARLIADDLLGTLAAFNDQQPVFNETVRRNFWNRWVFASGWDTDCTVQEPGKIRDRTMAESSLEVGTIMPGMPRSNERVKKNQNTPAHRLAGQPVFLRPQPNWDSCGVAFKYSDIRGGPISSQWVQHSPGYSPVRWRAEAAVRWDVAECKRVTGHNTTMVAFWAQCRLVHWLRDRQVDVRRPTEEVPRAEDHSKLVQLRACSMIIDEMTVLVSDLRSRRAWPVNNGFCF
ncbi:hypothetical protein Trihar35433_10918 [Trichoderma harzianum]|nr:hypothetical protein Trihar35433_10918 [Trichoderma harzianum]